MKNGAIAALLVVVIVAGTGIGYYIGTSSLRTTTSTTTSAVISWRTTTFIRTVTISQNVSAPCQVGPWSPESNSTFLPNGTVITRVFWPVFLMKPGSQATVCVAYHNPYNQTIPSNVWAEVLSWGPNVTALDISSQVKIDVSQSSLALSQGQKATVFYELDAPLNATGFYGLYLFQQCGLIPVAVGYQGSQVNLNDFPGLFGVSSCQAIFLDSQITGFTGGTLAYYACTLTPLPKAGPQTQYCE